MNKNDVLEILSQFDSDPNFKFDPIQHKYLYNNKHYISVTQFISRFHKPFEMDKWSKIKADELGITQDEMKAEWKMLNDRANVIGTATHDYIERYFKKMWTPIPNDLDIVDRINKFNKVYSTHLYKLEPIKFEQRIFSKKYNIAGMLDSLFLYNGNIMCVDWKTNKA
jgi:ATP-dependent exoDNAse (exonuclease V) beta subunit